MSKIYLYTAVGGLFLTVYMFGHYIGITKCTNNTLIQTIEHTQTQTNKKEKINAEVYRTSVSNIRNILREKYTISD